MLTEEQKREQLELKAAEGNVTAIQMLEKMAFEKRVKSLKTDLMATAVFEKPGTNADLLKDVPNLPFECTAIEKLKDLDISEIEKYIRKGEFDTLPEHMAVYLKWMEIAHDWYYKFKNKNWIVRYLMAHCKDKNGACISVYMANKVFSDMLSFFYSDKDFKKNSWFLYLAERIIMGAAMLWELNDFDGYNKAIEKAATIIDKINIEATKPDTRLLDRRPRFFVATAKQLGVPEADRNALARSIDEMPIPESVKLRVKGDLGVVERNLLDEDVKNEMEETK
jgi:hypothetical protein